jgi:F420-0:gamma-glutamyl ligase
MSRTSNLTAQHAHASSTRDGEDKALIKIYISPYASHLAGSPMLCMAKSTTGNVVASQGTDSCIAQAVVSLLFPIIVSCRSAV